MNGLWGVISVGIFADGTSNYGGCSISGPVSSNVGQFGAQVVGAVVCFVWAFGASYVFFKILDRFVKMRVSPEVELAGLDIPEMGVVGYVPDSLPGIAAILGYGALKGPATAFAIQDEAAGAGAGARVVALRSPSRSCPSRNLASNRNAESTTRRRPNVAVGILIHASQRRFASPRHDGSPRSDPRSARGTGCARTGGPRWPPRQGPK